MTAGPWGTITPRVWQAEALPLVVEAIRRGERPVLSATMGAGKSILLSALCRMALAKLGNGAIIVTAPTKRLVRQLAATMRVIAGAENVGVYYSDKKQPKRKIVITCNPSLAKLTESLARQGRRCKLLIVDECHRSEAAQVRDIVPELDPAAIVGVTATPFRSAASEALSLYTNVVYRYTWVDGRRDGVLVEPRYIWELEGSSSAMTSTDLNEMCLRLIRKHVSGPGIVSARDIPDAEEYAEWLSVQGFSALAIHSKMSLTEQDARVEQLRCGEISALVHVSMLSEGVDFPWLRWLCLRRPVGAKVRLVQEVGRGGRAFPGKDFFWCIDPHNLVGIYGLNHPEAIGEALEEQAAEAAPEPYDGEREPREIGPMPPGQTVSVAMAWAQIMLLSMQEWGVADLGIGGGEWRTRRPTSRQVSTLRRMANDYAPLLPCPHSDTISALSRVSSELQSGAVSDLIAILGTVAAAAPSHWRDRIGWRFPWPDDLVVAPIDERALEGLLLAGR